LTSQLICSKPIFTELDFFLLGMAEV